MNATLKKELSPEQKRQDNAYRFPYHYIAKWDEAFSHFSQMRYQAWGYRYAGGIKVVLDLLKSIEFKSLADVGCGDGRFLRELSQRYLDCNFVGIDYAEQPIRLARALNPHLHFEIRDVETELATDQYDVVTLIEVLEHIPPESFETFLSGVKRLLKKEGFLVLTVPHINQPKTSKHYRHFDSALLQSLLSPNFSILKMIPFDTQAWGLQVLKRICLGFDRLYLVTNRKINDFFFHKYFERYLYTEAEGKCQRLAAICRPSV